MKKNYLFLFLLMLTASFGWGQVIISQYYEGASNDKWIEITNVGNTDVNLSSPQVYLCLFANSAADNPGANSPTNNQLLSGTISAGQVILFKNSSSALPGYASGTSSSTCNFNGDDLIILSSSNGASSWNDRYDVIGNGTTWGGNTSFYRNSDITSTNTTYTTSEWTVVTNAVVNAASSGDSEYLGTHIYSSGSSNDTDAEAYNPGVEVQPAADDISSLVDTEGEKVDVFKMIIGEAGTLDGLPTHVTKVRIKPHSTNTADWTDHIQGAVLNDGSSDVTATVDITDTYIDFAIASGDLDIADGDFEELTLSIYLNVSGLSDGEILSFMVDADDHGFTADASGTGFMSTFSGGDFNSNDFTVDVEATQLSYVVQPSNVSLGVAISPDVEIAFTDENGNVDADYDGAGYGISLTTTGAFSGTATTAEDAVNGVSTFDNIKYSVLGNGITITASDEDGWGNTSAVSNAFNVINVSSTGNVIISEMCDPQDNYANDRYIEITNIDDVTIDLTGWSLDAIINDGSNVAFTWNLSGTIEPNESLTLGDTDNSVFTPDFAEATWSTSNGSWNGKTGDGAKLYDGSKSLVDNAGAHGSFENDATIRLLSVAVPTNTFNSDEWYTKINVSSPAVSTPGYHINVWTGNTNNSWSTAGNWSQGVVTKELCHAIIPTAITNMPTILAGSNQVHDLLIKSDESSDASLLGQENLTFNGTVTVERYISPYSGSSNGWHFISSPVHNMTIAGSDFVNGTFDLYRWAEDEVTEYRWYNYEDVDNTFAHTEFENGLGYLFAHSAGGIFEFTGALNSGSYQKDLDYNADRGDGWNLIGNPYPSAIDAEAITFTGSVNNGVYVVNPANGSYMAHNGGFGHPALADGHIPVNQGFFVQATGAGASVTIETADQVHSTNDFNKKSQSMPNESIMVTLSGENSDSYTFLGFRDDASLDFDGNYDAYELFGWATIPQIYSELNDVQYAINCLPHSEETVTVPLGISLQADEELSLNFSGMETFFNTIKIELEDKQLGVTQNIANNPTYTFQATTQDDSNRFLLHFNGVTGVEDAMETESIQVYSVENSIYVSSLENIDAEILVYNINGQLLYQDRMNAETLKKIDLNASSGVYLVNIVSEESVSTQKVYVK